MSEQTTDRPRTAAPPTPSTGPAPALQFVSRSGRSHSPRYRWGVLGIGIFAQAAFSAAFQGIPTSGTLLQSAYGYSLADLGIVLAAVTAGIFVTDVFWGMLSDRIGERTVLIIGMSGTTISLGAVTVFLIPSAGFAPSAVALAAVLFLSGAFGGSVNGASGRAVMGWFPPSTRGFALGLRVAAVPLGGAIGAAVLPPLALGPGFRWVFVCLTAFSLLATLAVVIWLDEPLLARSGDKGAATVPSPLRRWDIWRVAITALLLDLPQFTILTFGSVFLHTVVGLSIGTIVVLLVVVQVIGGASRVATGRWTDLRGGRHRRTLVRTYSWLIAAAFLGIACYAALPAWGTAVLVVVAGGLATGWHGVHYTEIASMAGAERSGTALGLENTMVFGGAFLTPLLIPPLLAVSAWPVVMVVIGAAPAVASARLMPREARA